MTIFRKSIPLLIRYSFIPPIFDWLKSKLNHNQFIVFTAICVGIAAGAMAAVLKGLVHWIQAFFNTDGLFSPLQKPWMVFFPTIGILLTIFFVSKVLKGNLGKGVSNILYEIAKKAAFVKRHKLYSHVLTSSLTVGFGGSAGLEAPIVITGSAVGSNIARSLRLTYRDRVLLLGCGAAAGIAAVFNSPVAGVMFAMEVLLSEVSMSSFIPLIISAAVGALFSKIIFNEETLFVFKLQESFNYHNVPFYVILGFVCGILSLYYVRVSHFINSVFQQWNIGVYQKALIGGLILAVLMYLLPPLFSEGYNSIRTLADGQPELLLKNSIFADYQNNTWVILLFLGFIIFTKSIAATITISSGGNGGNFAPSLFMGAFVGYTFAKIINLLLGLQLPTANFTIVAMAGLLSGVFYAPLTGIFLIAEVTGGYELIIPLMIVATLSSFLVRHFEPVSLEVKNMIEKEEVFSQNKDQNILIQLKIDQLIENDFQTIDENATLRQLIEVIKHSSRNLFAVINHNNELKGIITLDDVRLYMFENQLYDKIKVLDLMKQPPAIINNTDSMSSVMKKFDETEAWNLPVVDNNKYLGFISKSAIFSKYRSYLLPNN